LHGTWIGYFIGHAGDKRFLVELYEQDLDTLIVKGRSYTDQQQFHGQWTSEATSLDVLRSRLVFTYEFQVLSHASPLHGVTIFQLHRSAPHKPPIGLSGIAQDLNDLTRIHVNEEKLSDKLLPWEQALQKAAERFR